jgi:hypothetical protein
MQKHCTETDEGCLSYFVSIHCCYSWLLKTAVSLPNPIKTQCNLLYPECKNPLRPNLGDEWLFQLQLLPAIVGTPTFAKCLLPNGSNAQPRNDYPDH